MWFGKKKPSMMNLFWEAASVVERLGDNPDVVHPTQPFTVGRYSDDKIHIWYKRYVPHTHLSDMNIFIKDKGNSGDCDLSEMTRVMHKDSDRFFEFHRGRWCQYLLSLAEKAKKEKKLDEDRRFLPIDDSALFPDLA